MAKGYIVVETLGYAPKTYKAIFTYVDVFGMTRKRQTTMCNWKAKTKGGILGIAPLNVGNLLYTF